MNRQSLLGIVQGHAGLTVDPQETAVHVRVDRDDLSILFTVPYDVPEMYFEGQQKSTGKKIEDWLDYYGDEAESDFEADLRRFLNALQDCPLRVGADGRRIQYFRETWQHFFG
ncbi:MAG: hypothetical protein A3K19_31890 [Lentisphaerae bacterium RIFOXYB12_FULL_65_16]|nr:MAG: hypothetical protein A3K18_10670 [Lentisphaerae bacterium RIFOXYA12_64_32]OGV88703.1 MAG: hypothetical protein A3K19_31890 [Lentisphaerae bacterium RIFOXYB12_FULL_65_16]